MKQIITAALLAATTVAALPAMAADVAVSVQISQPGVYGRIDIGRFPQPQVVVQQPVIIVRTPVVVAPEPVYMWVPPGHRKNWRKHCGQYNACGVPVYFVQDEWYGKHVRSKGKDRDERGEHGDRGEGQGKKDKKDKKD